MDTITHALFAGLAAKSVTPRKKKFTGPLSNKDVLIITAFAGVFPDIDYLSFWINPLYFLAEWHRSITHSLFMAPIWGLFLTAIFIIVLPRLRVCVKAVLFYCILGLLSHVFLDILTVYGTEIFYPFSDRKISLATTFVVDPVFTVIIATVFFISLKTGSSITAIASILIVLILVFFQWQLKQAAVSIAEVHGGEFIHANSEITAIPQPFSPFHWRLIIQNDQEYSTALLDMTGTSEKLGNNSYRWTGMISAFKPPENLDWHHYSMFGPDTENLLNVRKVWLHDDFVLFRQFAEYPVLYRVDKVKVETCIWFTDLRYFISTLLPSFRYGMCRNQNSDWQLYRLKRFTENNRQQFNPG